MERRWAYGSATKLNLPAGLITVCPPHSGFSLFVLIVFVVLTSILRSFSDFLASHSAHRTAINKERTRALGMFILVQGQEFYHFNTQYLQSQKILGLKQKLWSWVISKIRRDVFFLLFFLNFAWEVLELIRIAKIRLRMFWTAPTTLPRVLHFCYFRLTYCSLNTCFIRKRRTNTTKTKRVGELCVD